MRRISAFTLVELLASVAVIGILVALLLPSLGGARNRAAATQCAHHLRQLQIIWQAYVDDFHGLLPSNKAVYQGDTWRNVTNSWLGPSNAVRDTSLDPIKQGLFWSLKYLSSAEILRCPGDVSRVLGSTRRRFRSYSMNGNAAGRTNELQRVVTSETQIALPAQLFIHIDEHEDSIDDGHFLVWSAPDDRWVNLPASRHGLLGVWSCADGHVEQRRWRAPKSFSSRTGYWKRAQGPHELADLRRLQDFVLSFDATTPLDPAFP